MVLLHEGAGAAAVWDETRAALAAASGRTVVAYDRRGYGSSARDASFGPDHFDQAADDLVALIAGLGDDPVDVVGHSDGGSIALLAAARRTPLIRTVTVVDTHVFADPQTVAGVRAMGHPADWPERTRAHYERLHGADWQDVVEAWLTMWTAPGGVLDWDIRPALAEIVVPVLVVHDRGDAVSPMIHAQAIIGGARSVRVSWYDDGSHRPHLKQPERFLRDLQQFWADYVDAE
ncbi:MAG: alpha/beta fold hydrolase [Frankiaceae bacterium]|nr:alpha/beta fold hydrolase [Frankiaceae bacterium]